jgi:hypothetical protein
MNTNSDYKKFATFLKGGERPKKENLDINSKRDDIIPTHIKLNSPPLKLSQACNEYEYSIDRTINTDLHEMSSNPSIICFCIYRVITCKNRSKPSYPFLQYLLYKYSPTQKSVGDMLVFPFIKYKTGSISSIAKTTTKSLTGEELSIKGFIEHDEQLFLFFDLQEINNIRIEIVNYKDRTQKLWWAIIDEICNSRKLITFPIHPSVYTIFYNNPSLIYLINANNKRIPIPKVGYYGNYYKLIPIIAALGGQNSIRGQLANTELFYFSIFRKAIRYGVWSPLYQERIAYNKKVTDIDGRYNAGGIVRFALFLEKIVVPEDKAYDQLSAMLSKPTSWKNYYNTLFIGSVDYDNININVNPEYILTNSDQYLSLSYHMIDMKSVPPNWDPSYDGYKIL